MDDIEISRLLDSTELGHGAHRSRADGMCAMELVAFIAGEAHSFDPACVAPLLTGFTIRLNDHMTNRERQCLKPFLPRLIGTNTGEDRRRFEAMARTAVVTLIAPALDSQGAANLADALRQRSQASLRELAGTLRRPGRDGVSGRLWRFITRDLGQAFSHAVEASERRQYGFQPNWNWCGGELGNVTAAAGRLGGEVGWSMALRVLEAGIDIAPPEILPPAAPGRLAFSLRLPEALRRLEQ